MKANMEWYDEQLAECEQRLRTVIETAHSSQDDDTATRFGRKERVLNQCHENMEKNLSDARDTHRQRVNAVNTVEGLHERRKSNLGAAKRARLWAAGVAVVPVLVQLLVGFSFIATLLAFGAALGAIVAHGKVGNLSLPDRDEKEQQDQVKWLQSREGEYDQVFKEWRQSHL